MIEELSKDYCTIVLRGPHLGVAEVLESRFPSPGYELMLATLFAEMRLSAGETVLEVGAGSGAAARWLARRTNGANRVTGLDINPYLLFEAAALISQERLGEFISLKDVPGVINLKLPPDLKTSLERRGSGVSEGGCADASLYDRFAATGIVEANYFIAAVTEVSSRSSLVATAQAGLSGADLSIWERALAEGVENGTFFITRFLHCAVGTKPAL